MQYKCTGYGHVVSLKFISILNRNRLDDIEKACKVMEPNRGDLSIMQVWLAKKIGNKI